MFLIGNQEKVLKKHDLFIYLSIFLIKIIIIFNPGIIMQNKSIYSLLIQLL